MANINSDMTKTAFFDNLQFKPSNITKTHIDPDDIALQIVEIINSSFVVTDMTITQKFGIIKK